MCVLPYNVPYWFVEYHLYKLKSLCRVFIIFYRYFVGYTTYTVTVHHEEGFAHYLPRPSVISWNDVCIIIKQGICTRSRNQTVRFIRDVFTQNNGWRNTSKSFVEKFTFVTLEVV